MLGQLLIPMATAFGFLFGGGSAEVPTVVAQVAGAAVETREETDAALEGVSAVESALHAKRVAKAQLARVYHRQLAEVERLRRRRASWNRDRELRDTRAEAHATGVKLGRIDREIRSLRALLERRRRVLLGAVERELDGAVSARRRAALEQVRRETAAALRPKPKKILVPDVQIDRLADPEELREQAALIRRAEQQLMREERKLAKRADRYQRVAKLREKRQRDAELGELDPSDVRRVTGRVGDPSRGTKDSGGGGGGAGADLSGDAESEPSQGGGAPSEDSGGFDPAPPSDDFSAVSVVLSDVVEPGTLDALRRAGRSASASARARAAARARKDVAAKLRRLRAQRSAIERRARALENR